MSHFIVNVTTRGCAICDPTRTTRWIVQASLATLAEVIAFRHHEELYGPIDFGTAKAKIITDDTIFIDHTYHNP